MVARLSKRMQKAREGLNAQHLYTLENAVKEIRARATAKFDETVDIAIRLNVDPRKADQNIRGMVSLPSGTGKKIRVAVFAKDEKAAEAKAAGADLVGAEDLAEKIQNGEVDFDRCIATPDMMVLVGRLGKVLGPKGLMPNPKLGTVTSNVKAAVEAAKSGQVEYRVEKNGIMHAGIGKVSFTEDQIMANVKEIIKTIAKAKPASVKGTFIQGISLSTTMGPSVKVDLAEVAKIS